MFRRTSPFGRGVAVTPQSRSTTFIIEPTAGIEADQPSTDISLGATPQSTNFIMREGALEPRPMLAQYTPVPRPMTVMTGGRDIVSVNGTHFPLISGTTALASYTTTAGWSVLSYVSSYGINAPPAGGSLDYWDFTQIYNARIDENIAIGGNGSYQTLYCWKSGATVFSLLTQAPRAKYVATFDNYVLTLNQKDSASGASFVQRVQWSDRGNPEFWASTSSSLAGFEDLLDMKGAGTRIIGDQNRVVLFSDEEIWTGVPGDFPFVFRFAPLDRTVGCPYPWTVAQTPLGLMFLGRDYQIYLLPKDGGTAQRVTQKIHRFFRNTITQPERAWALYDPTIQQYELFYAVKGGNATPTQALFVNIDTGAWTAHTIDATTGELPLKRGFVAQTSSSAMTWGGAGAAGLTWATVQGAWGDYLGSSEVRVVLAGGALGLMYQFSSTATNDDGTEVPCAWRSLSLAGEAPAATKTLTQIDMDYAADTTSAMTIRYSQNQGATFTGDTAVALPAASVISTANAYPYVCSRYPAFEVAMSGNRARLFRFQAHLRTAGR